MNIFSLSLLSSLSLSLFPLPNVEPPWEGGGAILGTTPHPTMLLYTISHHHTLHHPHYQFTIIANPILIFIIVLTLTLKPITHFGDH